MTKPLQNFKDFACPILTSISVIFFLYCRHQLLSPYFYFMAYSLKHIVFTGYSFPNRNVPTFREFGVVFFYILGKVFGLYVSRFTMGFLQHRPGNDQHQQERIHHRTKVISQTHFVLICSASNI